MRQLHTVIEEILKVAPDLRPAFTPTLTSLKYAAPELQTHYWNKAASILNAEAADHPKKNEIAAIFSGRSPATHGKGPNG